MVTPADSELFDDHYESIHSIQVVAAQSTMWPQLSRVLIFTINCALSIKVLHFTVIKSRTVLKFYGSRRLGSLG